MTAVSLETLWSIVDLSPILCTPWHLRKILFWVAYAGIAAAAVYAQLSGRYISKYMSYLETDILPLSVVVFSIEPLMILVAILVNQGYPEPPLRVVVRPRIIDGVRRFCWVDMRRLRRKTNRELAIVIACHNSRDIIPNTVKACLEHVRQEQIYIVDNGNSTEPTDDSRKVLGECSPNSRYIWNCYGNKTLAQYAGVMACKKYKYVLVLDDDVILPPNLDMGLDLIKDDTVGVAFPIRAAHPQRKYSLFIEWQSLEYQLTGYNKLMQSKTGTVQYPHGAASLWDRKALKTALRSHDTVFFAEDAKLGLWALKSGYTMAIKPEVPILTEAPTTVLGEMPNFWTQRVRSWDMALHAYFWQYVQVLCCSSHKSCCGVIFMKMTQLYTVYTILADWIRLPVLVLYIGRVKESYVYLVLYLVSGILLLLLWNLVAYHKRPDLRLSHVCIFTFPLYAGLVLVTRFFGLLRALFVYLPNYQRPLTIPEIEHKVMESWQQALMAEEAGMDSDDEDFDDSELVVADGASLSPPEPNCKEPVWLTDDELLSLGITTRSSATGLASNSRAAALGQETVSVASSKGSDGILRGPATTQKSTRLSKLPRRIVHPPRTEQPCRTPAKKSTPVDLDDDIISTDTESKEAGSVNSKSVGVNLSPRSAKNRVTWKEMSPNFFSNSPEFAPFPYLPKDGKDESEDKKNSDIGMKSNRPSTDSRKSPLHRVAWSTRGSVETILLPEDNTEGCHVIGMGEQDSKNEESPRSVLPSLSSRRMQRYSDVHGGHRKNGLCGDPNSLNRERVKHVLEKATQLLSDTNREGSVRTGRGGKIYIDI